MLLLISCLMLLALVCGLCVWVLFCYSLLSVFSSFGIILLGKRGLFALLLCYFECILLLTSFASSSRCRGLVWLCDTYIRIRIWTCCYCKGLTVIVWCIKIAFSFSGI